MLSWLVSVGLKIVELLYLSTLMRHHEKIKYTNPTLYKKLF